MPGGHKNATDVLSSLVEAADSAAAAAAAAAAAESPSSIRSAGLQLLPSGTVHLQTARLLGITLLKIAALLVAYCAAPCSSLNCPTYLPSTCKYALFLP